MIGSTPGVHNRADLAVQLGVSRARITQALRVLDAHPSLLAALERAEGQARYVGVAEWRRLRILPLSQALAALETGPMPSHGTDRL